MRVVTLFEKRVSLGVYVRAIKTAKANPDQEFKRGLTTWRPTTGQDILRQFHDGMNARINEAIPYVSRGKPLSNV
ncbi:MAG TPA: hypothetical protein VFU31_07860 [Candidatus Binatia bacterium]|nr:hypothetical protein [Candidatus Binatia bacterium]